MTRWLAGVVVLAQAMAAHAEVYRFDWFVTTGGTGADSVADVAVSPAGEVYALGTGSFAPGDTSAGWVAKFSADGRLLWRRALRGATPWGIAVDAAGTAWIVAWFNGTATLESPSRTATLTSTRADSFVAQYSTAGELLRTLQLAAGGPSGYLSDVAVDSVGNGYVVGAFDGALHLGGDSLTGDVLGSSLVAKLDPTLTPLWARQSVGMAMAYKVGIDGAGNVVAAGDFAYNSHYSSVSFGSVTVYADGPGYSFTRGSSFLVRYPTDGSQPWALSLGPSGVADVSVDVHGDIVVAGDPQRDDGAVFTRPLTHNQFYVARLAPDGTLRWMEVGERAGVLAAWLRPDGSVLLSGGASSLLPAGVVGPWTLPMGVDVLIPMSAAGDFGMPFPLVTGSDAHPFSLVGAGGNAFVAAGTFLGTITHDTVVSTSAGDTDGWLGVVRPHVVPPDPDGTEGTPGPTTLAGPTHVHWRCSSAILRRLGARELQCLDIFQNGASSRGAEDVFSARLDNLTLHTTTDVDQFVFSIPDPDDPALPAPHADISPSTPPIPSPSPQPLLECGAVPRRDFGPDGRVNLIYVTTAGQLVVTIIPTVNAHAQQGVVLDGESIHLYDGARRLDDITHGSSAQVNVQCPRGRYGLRDVMVSVGERATPRSGDSLGGYSILVEYRIDAQRGIPAWAAGEADGRAASRVLPLRCPGGGRFPLCGGAFSGFDIMHSGLPGLDCLNDGPGCMQLFAFDWPDGNQPFSLALSAPAGMEVTLYDGARQVLAHGMVAKPPAPLQLDASLAPGVHLLQVRGPDGALHATLRPATSAQPRPGLPSPGWLVLAAIFGAVVTAMAFAVRRRR
jgi:hypothetical protein